MQRILSERQEVIFNRKAEQTDLDSELRKVAYKNAKVKGTPEDTLVKARNTYQLCLDRYLQVSEKDETLRARLEEKLAMAEHSEMRFRRELGDGDASQLDALVADGALADRTAEATRHERNAAMAVGAAEAALTSAREALRELQPVSKDFSPLKKDLALKTLEKVQQRQTEQQQKLKALELQIEDEKKSSLRRRTAPGKCASTNNCCN